MSNNILLHNESCSKSNAAHNWLIDHNIEFTTRNYLSQPLTYCELEKLQSQLNINATELVRTNETEWIENTKDCTMSNDEILRLIERYPVLLQRPIFIKDDRAVVARPIEKLIELYK